jgi:hypothetical protein
MVLTIKTNMIKVIGPSEVHVLCSGFVGSLSTKAKEVFV